MASQARGANLLGELNTLTKLGVVGNLSDSELLGRFLASSGDSAESAFAALVCRHGPMVLEVCHNVLRDHHDAQDAFQATFMVLASRARSIRRREAVASWLLGVAHRVAVRAKAKAVRRKMYEREAAEMGASDGEDPPESWPELHEEISRLPERYRGPVVLCYLEGLSTEAAALRLGCPKGTVLSRLSRARNRLRGRLTRRGLVLPTAVLCVGTTLTAARAVIPPGLLTATVRASLLFTEKPAAAASLSSASAVALAVGVVSAMIMSNLKTLGAAILACVLAMGGLQYCARVSGKTGGTSRLVRAEAVAKTRTMKITVVDADGKPTQGAHVFRNHVYQPEGSRAKIENQDYWTDEDGKALIRLAGTSVDLRLWVRKTGFVPLHAMWAEQFQSDGGQIPEEFTFRLTPGTEIGGVVVNEKGEPIEGVKIEVKDQTAEQFHVVPIPKKPGQRPVRSASLAEGDHAIVTDARGQWRLGNVPPGEDEPQLEIVLHVNHPDYISNELGWGDLQRSQGVTLKSLRELTARVVLRMK